MQGTAKGTTIKIPEDIREKVNALKGRKSFGFTFVELAEIGLRVKAREEALLKSAGITQEELEAQS